MQLLLLLYLLHLSYLSLKIGLVMLLTWVRCRVGEEAKMCKLTSYIASVTVQAVTYKDSNVRAFPTYVLL